MLPIKVAIAVIFQVPNHLLGCALDPPRGHSTGALVAPELAKVPRLAIYDPAGVVVGKRVFRVFGPGFGFVVVAVAESPWVWSDRGGVADYYYSVFGSFWGEIVRKWSWRNEVGVGF